MDTKSDSKAYVDMSDWPNTVRTRDELDEALKEGRKSEICDLNILQVASEAKTRLKRRV